MQIKVLVGGSANSPNYQVFEMKRKLPKFSQFCYVKSLKHYYNQDKTHKLKVAQSNVIIEFNERIPRVGAIVADF